MPWTVLTFEPDPNPTPQSFPCPDVDAVLDALARHVFDYEAEKARAGKRYVRGRSPTGGPPVPVILRLAPFAGLTDGQRESLRERLCTDGPNFDLTIAFEDSALGG